MNIDFLRVGLLFAGLVAGVATYFLAPALGERSAAFTGTVVTVFSILAGIQLAIFALLGGLQPARFRRGTSIASARRTAAAKRLRQLFIFYVYFVVMFAIVLNQAFDFGDYAALIERLYVALSVAALVWSLGLPLALSSIQDDANTD